MLSSLHCISQEDDLYQQWPVCGFSIALLRYLQTWWRKKQQISLFAQVDRGIFFSQVDRWIFLVSLIRQDALAKSLIINASLLLRLAQHGMSEAIELWKCCKTMMSSFKSTALKPKASFGKMDSSQAFLLSDQIIPFQKIHETRFILFANLLILENQKGVNSPWRQAIGNWLSL